MALTLTATDRARFEAAAQAALSLSTAPDADEACRTALDRILELFQLERAAFRIPEGDRVRLVSRGFDPEVVEKLATVHAGVEAGRNRYADPDVDRVMRRLHERRCDVWDFPLMERLTGMPRERQRLYHEIAGPAGVRHHAAAAVSLPRGKAMVGIAYDDPDDGRFGRDRLAVLRMLHPAIEAGIRALWSSARRRETLSRTLDRISDGLLVSDSDGRELHRNRALCRLLEQDPRPDALIAGMHRAAERLASLRGASAKTDPIELVAPGTRAIETPLSRYTVRASLLAPGTFAPDGSVLVALERTLPELPSERSLRRRFGLTARQAEIALLVAHGRSNAEIADRLDRSPHTIRHHIEHIFRKLGIHSRKALALRLLAGGRE